jgi:putative ABC transport system permease protein
MRFFFRLLVAFYPPSIGREHGAEMQAAIDAGWRAASSRGWRARVRFVAQLVDDFVTSWPGAWRGRPRGAAPRATKGPSHMLHTFVRDVRMALRVTWRNPLSSATMVLTLALAIGANAAVFSVVHAVVLKPLPYADPDRLVAVWERNIPQHGDRNSVGPANFLEWQQRAHSFSALVAFGRGSSNITGDAAPEHVQVWHASWNVFDALGVQPAIGRGFRESESVPNAESVAVISWELWQRRYHGDASLVGRVINLGDHLPRRVTGVLPPGFRLLGTTADIWVPLRFTAESRAPRGRSLRVFGRLAPGVSISQADAELDTIAAQLEQQWPAFDTGWRTHVVGLRDDLTGPTRVPLLLLLGAVGVVLLVGCANVANLLLARASARRREMALRAAIGASQAQLVRQLFVEGLCLSAAGMLGGLLAAQWALARLLQWMQTTLHIPRLDEAHLSWPVLGFSLALMGLCALIFSLAPAAQLSAARLMPALLDGGRGSAGGRRDKRTREGLVIVQVALAVVLVVAGGLVTRSLIRLTAIEPGFDAAHVLTFEVDVPEVRYPKRQQLTPFLEDTLDQVRHIPGVEAASGIAFLPFSGPGIGTSFWVVGRPEPPAGQFPVTEVRPIDDEFFHAMRIPIRTGRAFTHDEVLHGTHVAIVNEALVRQMFAGINPLGQHVTVDLEDQLPNEIVGVAGDIKIDSLQAPARPMVYYPFGREALGFMTFVVRSSIDTASLTKSAEAVVQHADRDIPLTDVRTMESLVSDAVASPALASMLIAVFAALALLLALVGISGLLATTVAARRPEFGVRLALGATPGGIRRLVLAHAGRMIGAGLAIGLAAAVAISRLTTGLLYGVPPLDATVYIGTAAAVALLAFMASDISARRATRVDPVIALRE